MVRQRQRLQHLNSVADVARALLLIEGAVGSKQNTIGPEEFNTAYRRSPRAFDRGVSVKVLEIILFILYYPRIF